MPDELKYPLTRICLRSGQLTLPLKMLELFPDEGTVRAVDSHSGDEFSLTMQGPRVVAGLGEFFRTHKLDVNDEVLIRPLGDGRYALTPNARPKKANPASPDIGRQLADRLLELGSPLSEAEIRSLVPELPRDVDVKGLLERDGRLAKREGRWMAKDKVMPEPLHAVEITTGAVREFAGAAEEVAAYDDAPAAPASGSAPPYTQAALFPGEVESDLAVEDDLAHHARARAVLQAFGFGVEVVAPGQLVARADLGRRHYTVLVQVHPPGARLDWARLLARRREVGAMYLAVFGEHRDLGRLHSPAGLARATLWSWTAIERAKELLHTVAVSPFDLEPYFQRDGLFEHGLKRFESAVGKRVTERGNFSAVLNRLAAIRAPAIFLLEDVVADLEVSRDQVLKVLEQLSQEPFQLVAKVDNGEFCLRYPLSEGLRHLSDYALSLRERLPARHTERLRGALEPHDEGFMDDGVIAPAAVKASH